MHILAPSPVAEPMDVYHTEVEIKQEFESEDDDDEDELVTYNHAVIIKSKPHVFLRTVANLAKTMEQEKGNKGFLRLLFNVIS